MSDERDNEGRAERLLRDGAWTEQLDRVDLNHLNRRMRRRRTLAAVSSGVAVVGLASVAAVIVVQAGGQSSDEVEQPAASTSTSAVADGIPWIDTRPKPQSADVPSPCNSDALSVSLGRTGAWHGMATQAIKIVNKSGDGCQLPAQMSVEAQASDSQTTSVDTANLPKDGVVLAAAQEADLIVGAPAGCADSVIAKHIDLTIGDKSRFQLDGAWVPLSCGSATVVSLDAMPVEPETQNSQLSAAIEVADQLIAGQTASFAVTLTNGSDEPIGFKDCPSYDIALKAAGLLETYALNCDAAGPIAPGDSTVFQMELNVPADATGDDELSWALDGYPAVASVPVSIK